LASISVQADNTVESENAGVEHQSLNRNSDANEQTAQSHSHKGRCKKLRTVIVFLRKDDVSWHRSDILSNLEHFELPAEGLYDDDEHDEEIYDKVSLERPIIINFDISNFLSKDESRTESEKQQRKLIKEKIRHSLKKKYCNCACTKSYMYHYLNGSTATFRYEEHIRSTLEELYSRKETNAREKFEAESHKEAAQVLLDDNVDGEDHKDSSLDDIEGLTEAELKLLSEKQRKKIVKKTKKQCARKCEKAGIATEWVHIYF